MEAVMTLLDIRASLNQGSFISKTDCKQLLEERNRVRRDCRETAFNVNDIIAFVVPFYLHSFKSAQRLSCTAIVMPRKN